MNGLAVSSDSSRSSETSPPTGRDHRRTALERGHRLARGVEVGDQRLVAAGLLLQPRDRLLQRLQVGQDQLGLDRRQVGLRVHLAVDVGDVVVAEHPGDLADRGRLADVGEELVAETLALGRAADDAGDVDELDGRGHQPGRLHQLTQRLQARVGDADDADVRLDRGERVVRREDVVLGQRVEERGLAGVGKADDADGESHGRRVYGAGGGGLRIAAVRRGLRPAARRDGSRRTGAR